MNSAHSAWQGQAEDFFDLKFVVAEELFIIEAI
jgi:hypothetical protein